MMKPIAVVGCGPAGLTAAHALRLAGVPMALFSRDEQASKLGGAQFLHQPIPGVNEAPDFMLEYRVIGPPEGYQRKVYGDADVPFVSMARVQDRERIPAWSLVNTYQRLWDEFRPHVNVEHVDADKLIHWLDEDMFSAIITSAPRPATCKTHAGLGLTPHVFVSQRVRIMNESVLGSDYDNQVIYDGTPNVSWYRTSRINGIGSTEWGEGAPAKMPYKDLVSVNKPIRTNCDCWTRERIPVLPVGRFGTWRKGELVHDAFDNTVELLRELGVLS